ncbi:MAG: hypothetical protein ACLT1X_12080 [Christensenellales bacterium]
MSKRLLRSLLSLMVCMAMLLSLAPAALAESADAPSTEMAVGAVIHGFEVVENGEFALLNAKTTVLRHQKTGATVFFLINEDTNRAFDISFVTLSDDKGIRTSLSTPRWTARRSTRRQACSSTSFTRPTTPT